MLICVVMLLLGRENSSLHWNLGINGVNKSSDSVNVGISVNNADDLTIIQLYIYYIYEIVRMHSYLLDFNYSWITLQCWRYQE